MPTKLFIYLFMYISNVCLLIKYGLLVISSISLYPPTLVFYDVRVGFSIPEDKKRNIQASNILISNIQDSCRPDKSYICYRRAIYLRHVVKTMPQMWVNTWRFRTNISVIPYTKFKHEISIGTLTLLVHQRIHYTRVNGSVTSGYKYTFTRLLTSTVVALYWRGIRTEIKWNGTKWMVYCDNHALWNELYIV